MREERGGLGSRRGVCACKDNSGGDNRVFLLTRVEFDDMLAMLPSNPINSVIGTLLAYWWWLAFKNRFSMFNI